MNTAIEFLTTHWETLSVLILWIVARVVPTKKNYDFVELLLQFIGKLIPNRRVDSLGNQKP